MKKVLTALIVVVVAFAINAEAQQLPDYLYSTDLGSDMDLSDPSGNGVPGTMDCGAIYRVGQGVPNPIPVLWKDDDAPVPGAWTGYPFQFAPQPIPGQATPPGGPLTFFGVIPEQDVASAYAAYFDLDGEDQITQGINIVEGTQATPQEFAAAGIYVPTQNNVRMSFENDDAPGWFDAAHISDVPTVVKIDNDIETYAGGISCKAPLPNVATVEYNETQMGLGLPPSSGQDHDDDVDALDWHPEAPAVFIQRYFTADHEAHLGLDPGDIYLTVNNGTMNIAMAIDDVTQIGVLDTTDIDAWEFVNIDIECAQELWPDFAASLDPNLNVLAAIFSVDQDDPDTSAIDESGGLNPSVIYMTNLIGQYAAVSGDYSELGGEVDIDALTLIPEPATMSLLALGGLALLRRRRAL